MTRKMRRLLEQLDRIAGDPRIVDEGFRTLGRRHQPIELNDLLDYILRRRAELEAGQSPARET